MKADDPKRVIGPGWYANTAEGLRPVTLEVAPSPDAAVWVCRRVVDYAPAPVPAAGAIGQCGKCYALVVFNPFGPLPPDAPKYCFQCVGIAPLPLEPKR